MQLAVTDLSPHITNFQRGGTCAACFAAIKRQHVRVSEMILLQFHKTSEAELTLQSLLLFYFSFWQERDKTKNLLNSYVHKHGVLWGSWSDPPIQLTLLA